MFILFGMEYMRIRWNLILLLTNLHHLLKIDIPNHRRICSKHIIYKILTQVTSVNVTGLIVSIISVYIINNSKTFIECTCFVFLLSILLIFFYITYSFNIFFSISLNLIVKSHYFCIRVVFNTLFCIQTKRKYSGTKGNGQHIYKLISKAVYNKIQAVYMNIKKLTKKYFQPLNKIIDIFRILS